jgi:hypothetical protein
MRLERLRVFDRAISADQGGTQLEDHTMQDPRKELKNERRRAGRELAYPLGPLAWGVQALGHVTPLRHTLLRAAERALRAHAARPEASLRHLPAVAEDRLAMALALLDITEKAFSNRALSARGLRGLVKVLLASNLSRRRIS